MTPSSLISGYYAELDFFCIFLLIQLQVKTRRSSFLTTQKRCFECVLLCHIVFTASDLIWVFNNGFLSLLQIFPKYGIIFSYAVNGLNVIFSGITGFAWLVFSETMQGNYMIRDRKKFICALCPALLLAALTITTGRTHILFYISGQGEFFRCNGYAVQVLVSMGYIVTASVLSARRMLRANNMQERSRSRAVMGFITAPLCAMVLQVVFPRIQVLFLGTVFALISVYISLQETQILTDPLTGLNNRMQLDQKANDALKTANSEYDVYLMVIDADNFKSVNDGYGHLIGDYVLRLVADALRRSCGAKDYVCRCGGDEFAVLHYAPKNEDCTQFVQKVDELLEACDAPCPVSVSIGVCRRTPDIETVSEWISAADEDMYRVKAARKSKQASAPKMRGGG